MSNRLENQEIRIRKPRKELVEKLKKFGAGIDSVPVAAQKALHTFFRIK